MQYMGNKGKYASRLIPVIRPNATGLYVEPFLWDDAARQGRCADWR